MSSRSLVRSQEREEGVFMFDGSGEGKLLRNSLLEGRPIPRVNLRFLAKPKVVVSIILSFLICVYLTRIIVRIFGSI